MQTPKCTSGLEAIQICVNPDCFNQNPFVCNGCKHNKCLQKHKKCKRQEWKQFKSKLQLTRTHTDPAFVNLSAKIYQAILKTIKYFEKEMQNFFMWKVTFGMPVRAKQLLESISNHREMNWNGRQMHLLLQDVHNHNKITFAEKNQLKLKKQIEGIYTKADELQKMIKNLYHLEQKQRPETNLSRYRIRNSSRSKAKNSISASKELVIRYDSFRTNSPKSPSTQKKIKKNFLKIKQTHLEDLMRRIGNIKESPQTLELKFSQYWNNDPQQFAKLLRSQRLNDTKILIVYWPSVIDDHDYFRQMCESLLTLPKLEIFKMISNGQNSKNAFKQLGKRFKSVVQKQWWKGEDWKF